VIEYTRPEGLSQLGLTVVDGHVGAAVDVHDSLEAHRRAALQYACHEGNRSMVGILAGARAGQAKPLRRETEMNV
jgi:hypothetical protein